MGQLCYAQIVFSFFVFLSLDKPIAGCYCNNIAPNETNRTCRVVGAHRKESKGRADASPARKEYHRTYNRLKQRKTRGKMSVAEWNIAVAKAQELLTQAEQGLLTDEELKKKLLEL